MRFLAAIGNALSQSFALLFQDPNWYKTEAYMRRSARNQQFLDKTVDAQF